MTLQHTIMHHMQSLVTKVSTFQKLSSKLSGAETQTAGQMDTVISSPPHPPQTFVTYTGGYKNQLQQKIKIK